ncbi:ribonuclease h protein [Artemisia annua]|uniref:Ribonuclease h protein n=1 Tax=Artemisia annua TaxID=35608 RepID=A0A2U1L0H8_ARTAN|nr:ribonuclease h protein [Artemisia annua]
MMQIHVFMPMPTYINVMVPLHHHHASYQPSYVHHIHSLLQQQEKSYYHASSETNYTTLKSRWMFPEGPSSIGGVIRYGKGRCVCGYMGKMEGKSYASLEAKVWSIYKGLCLIKDKNLSHVLIEMDCESAIQLGLKEVDKGHPFKYVLEAIWTIMKEQKCTMVHTRRDGNHCADRLANLGGRQYEEYIVLEKPPALLLPYLIRDTKSATELEQNYQW